MLFMSYSSVSHRPNFILNNQKEKIVSRF
jgi:hypothetical protein